MFFAKDSIESITISGTLPAKFNKYGGIQKAERAYSYSFPHVEYLSEEEAVQYFKQKFNYWTFFNNQKSNLKATKSPTPEETPPSFNISHIDLYLFPKVFDKWFPFLDCDTDLQYQSCIGVLGDKNIPHVVYNSSENENKKWIFCDVESSFENAIKFIESCPADPAYVFCAKHRKHLCVRAFPKKGIIPTKIDSHLEDNFSNRFKFWIDEFDDYWNNGEIIKYMEYLKIINNI